jgi:uncharacterized repeat protein (TIGR01451 family)
VVAGLFGAVALAGQYATADQNPADCNTNLLILALSRPSLDPDTGFPYQDGTTIEYEVTLAVPAAVGSFKPCQITDITSSFTDPAGSVFPLPNVATLNPGDSTTFTSLDEAGLAYVIAHGDEDVNNAVTAEAEADGTAHTSTNNNAAHADNNITTEVIHPDLHLVKDAVDGLISAGEDACFTITVTNEGEGSAFNALMSDTLPGTGWTIDSNSAGWDCQITGGNLLECTAAEFTGSETGGSQEESVTVCRETTADDCGLLENSAEVTNDLIEDPDEFPNSDDADIAVVCPDIHVDKTADNTPVTAGDEACFTIVVSNSPGDATAFDVELDDTLPGTGWSISAEDGSACNITPDTNDILHCDIGTMAPDTTYTVTVCRDTTADDCGELPNTATVSASNESESDAQDNEDIAIIVVDCPPDVHVDKSADNTPINAGEDACFTILVSNDGVGEAANVDLDDTLPGTGWVIDAEDGSACNITPGTDDALHCDIGDLQAGGTYSVTVCRATTADDCGELPNTATVSATNELPDDQTDNEDSATIVVNCADVHVAKTADNSPINAGDQACFTIVVSNDGVGDATGVTLDDTLPGTGWSITAEDGSACNITPAANDALHCDIGDLASGGTYSVTVCRTTTETDCGELPNTATVAADNEPQDDQSDNSDSATIVVECPGGEGCTPGFWQGGVGIKLWNTSPDAQWTAAGGVGNPPFIQTTLFNNFFTPHAFLNGRTMLDLVGTGGGPNPVRKAARMLVAAYLNTSFGLSYPFSTAQLSAAWTAAVNDGSPAAFQALHLLLGAANELGCNIGNPTPSNGQINRTGPTGVR